MTLWFYMIIWFYMILSLYMFLVIYFFGPVRGGAGLERRTTRGAEMGHIEGPGPVNPRPLRMIN